MAVLYLLLSGSEPAAPSVEPVGSVETTAAPSVEEASVEDPSVVEASVEDPSVELVETTEGNR
jgi:hypothetical protein